MGERAVALARQDGWRSEGAAARVHYDGGGERYSIEYYERGEHVLYWAVRDDTAHPVARESVPTPLRERIRSDLDAAGIDPAIESRTL